MIYAYFDANRVLKELINDTVNSGDSNVNKIAVYWEDDIVAEGTSGYTAGIRYQKSNKTYYPSTFSDMVMANTYQTLEIPYNRKQDLKYFKYGVKYGDDDFPDTHAFRVFTIPDDVLENDTDDTLPVLVSVFIGGDDTIYTLDRFAFNVGPSTASVAMNEHINLAEWNTLLKIVFNKQLYIVNTTASVNVADYKPYDMFFGISQQGFYYITYKENAEVGSTDPNDWQLASWQFGLSFDNIPTQNSENAVTSGGIYSWVLSQINQLGTLKAHICTDADDTPYGITWGSVTGTLSAEEAAVSTMYLVPDGDAYIEYYPIGNVGSKTWEIIGKTSITLPETPANDGKYELTVNVASGVATYSWVDDDDWVISTSGTVFDRTDNRYKLLYDGNLYSYVSNGFYCCVASSSTLKTISVDASTYVWTSTSQTVSATSNTQFSIGSYNYTIPTLATILTVSVGENVDYALLKSRPDYLIKLAEYDRFQVFHFIGEDGSENLCYSNIPIAGIGSADTSITYMLIKIANNDGTVSASSNVYNKVVANPTGTATTPLTKLQIAGVNYSITSQMKEFSYTVAASTTSGTFPAADIAEMEEFKSRGVIVLNKKYYYFADDMSSSDYLIYTHTGYDNTSAYYVKCLTVYLNGTNSWILISQHIAPLYRYHIIATITVYSATQYISWDTYSNKNIGSESVLLTEFNGKSFACGETFRASQYALGLIKSVSLNASETKISIQYQPLTIVGATPSTITTSDLTTATYTLDNISYEKEEL